MKSRHWLLLTGAVVLAVSWIAWGCTLLRLDAGAGSRRDAPVRTAPSQGGETQTTSADQPPSFLTELLVRRETWEAVGLIGFTIANVWAGPIDRRRYHGRSER